MTVIFLAAGLHQPAPANTSLCSEHNTNIPFYTDPLAFLVPSCKLLLQVQFGSSLFLQRKWWHIHTFYVFREKNSPCVCEISPQPQPGECFATRSRELKLPDQRSDKWWKSIACTKLSANLTAPSTFILLQPISARELEYYYHISACWVSCLIPFMPRIIT